MREVLCNYKDNIEIIGASENNLKHIDLTIPKGKLVVLAGVSGSGKSSLAFDTIAVESARQGMIDSESTLSEFKALCARYVSGIEALHHRADIFAGMSISQFDALGDSAYSVTTAIKGFFEKVHEIRHEMEKEHEN